MLMFDIMVLLVIVYILGKMIDDICGVLDRWTKKMEEKTKCIANKKTKQ